MKLIKNLQPADYVSLSASIFIWSAMVNIIRQQAFLAITFSLLAFFVDMADGWVARKTGRASAFGLQLDTIIDTLNYPVFTALFTWQFILTRSVLGSVVAVIILIFSSLRLSRMAVNGIQQDAQTKRYYEGIVTPHLLAAEIILYYVMYFITPLPSVISAGILILLSVGMVSRVKVYKPENLTGVIIFTLLLLVISICGQLAG